MEFLPLPDKVYKYRTAEAALNVLKDQIIYLASISEFNDPFDSRIPMNFTDMADNEELQRQFAEKFLVDGNLSTAERKNKVNNILTNGKIRNRENLRRMEQARIKKMEEFFRLYCLSAVPDNLLMWAHYSDSHKGVCIGFNPKKLIEVISPVWVAPVGYSFEYPRISVLEHPEKILEILLFNKSIDWIYEKEIRYVKNWQNGDCKIQIPVDSVEEIYFGCMTTKENEDKIMQVLRDKYQHVKINKFKKDNANFRLQIANANPIKIQL